MVRQYTPGDERIRVFPDFDGFAKDHPWIGAKVGEVQTLPHRGYLQQFQNASVYGVIGGDPHEVHGAIRDKYIRLGGPAGFLGYPITDETATPDGKGRFNRFQSGVIYWHPAIGAFEVHGAIRDKWAALGWETSFLGYPVSDEHDSGGGRQSDFQFGSIFWTAGSGTELQPQWLAVDRPSIAFGTGISVGGYGRLTIFSDGTTHFQGHLHDSGFPSYDCLAVFTVKDADGRAYTATSSGRVHGTDEPGSRDLDWDDWGTNDDIRRNWPRIRAGAVLGSQVSVTSDWSPQKIAEDVAAAVGLVLAVIPLIFGGGGADKSSDPNYGRPEDYPPGGEPPPGQMVPPAG